MQGVNARLTSVRLLLTYRNGRVKDLGAYPVVAGAAVAGARVLGNPADTTSARLAAADGTTVATAL
jgi:hypothetical protein